MSKKFVVEKEIEWDMAHRIVFHKSKCRNLHGHRYRLIVAVEGPLNDEEGSSDHGMVLDFSDIKKSLTQDVHDPLDHGTLVFAGDEKMQSALGIEPESWEDLSSGSVYDVVAVENDNDWNVWVSNFMPTAENLSRWAFEVLSNALNDVENGISVKRVTLYETPTSAAIYEG